MRKVWLIGVLAIFISLGAGGNVVMATPVAYTVKTGDCLWNIASTTGVSVDSIKQLNGLSSDLLHIGQVLTLSNSAATVVQAAPSVPAGDSSSVYVIQLGDNLWTIAQKFGTTVDNIKALNRLTSDALYAGETLRVSGAVASMAVSRSGDNVTGARVVAKAAQYLGTPYKYGGSSPGGFDCSGFSSYIFRQFNISLYRSAAAQYGNGVAVSKANLIPGDLVFFNCAGSGISHVGIYSGNGQFIHSSSPNSGGVIYSPLNTGYYGNTYVGARRVIK